MVRTHNRPREPASRQLANLLGEESESDGDDQFEPRGSSSRNNTQSSSRSPERRSTRNASTSQQQQPQASTRNQNQAGTSRGNKQNVTGAAKRKTKKPTVKSTFKTPLHQIRFLQTHTENLIPKLPLSRLVREILYSHGDFRMTRESLDALQEAAEAYLVGVFDDAFRLTLHRSRVTIQPIDIQLLLYLRGGTDPGVP